MIIWLFSSSLGYYNIWFLSFLSNLKVSLCFVNLLHSLCKVVFFLDGFFKRNSFSFINCSFPFFLFMEFEFFSIFRKRSVICIYWFFGWVIFWIIESPCFWSFLRASVEIIRWNGIVQSQHVHFCYLFDSLAIFTFVSLKILFDPSDWRFLKSLF